MMPKDPMGVKKPGKRAGGNKRSFFIRSPTIEGLIDQFVPCENYTELFDYFSQDSDEENSDDLPPNIPTTKSDDDEDTEVVCVSGVQLKAVFIFSLFLLISSKRFQY